MHLIYLGVVKRMLLKYYVEGTKKKQKLSQGIIRAINNRIEDVSPHVTSDFVRKPRPLGDIRRWKATELRLFITYTCPVLLYNVIHPRNYEHVLLLHCATFILSNISFVNKYIGKAQSFLEKFVIDSSSVLDNDFVSYNVHSLLHLCDDVKMYGPLPEFWCFPFENYLNTLKRKIHSKKHPLQQLCNRIFEKDLLEEEVGINLNTTSGIGITGFNEVYDSDGSLLSCKYKKLKLNSFLVSVKTPDNCVILKKGKICIIQKIQFFNNRFVLTASWFTYQHNLYEYPMMSSDLYIYYVKSLTHANVMTFKVSTILYKAMLLPYKDGYAVFPIVHTVRSP